MLPNLLICGLDPLLLDTRRLILERCGYQVWCASNLVNARQIIQSRRVDLLILCHSLSTDECDQLRAIASIHSPQTKILTLSAGFKGCRGEMISQIFDTSDGPAKLLSVVEQLLPKSQIEEPQAYNISRP